MTTLPTTSSQVHHVDQPLRVDDSAATEKTTGSRSVERERGAGEGGEEVYVLGFLVCVLCFC